MVEIPVRWRVVQFTRELPEGKSRPWLVRCLPLNGPPTHFVLKWRIPDQGPDIPVVSLVNELVCSIVARTLGLKVPEFGLLELTGQMVDAAPTPECRRKVEKNLGVNFGTVFHQSAAAVLPDARFKSKGDLRRLEEILCFDASILNGDRTSAKPNLLYDGEFYLIDHAIALYIHAQGIKPDVLFPDLYARSHISFSSLQSKDPKCEELFGRWSEVCRQEFWASVDHAIPPEWKSQCAHEIATLLDFLQNRVTSFAAHTVELRRVLR